MASRNQELFDQSLKLIPGGVNSPVRAFKSVGGTPLFITRGHGATVWDADGKAYTDYVGSWGPLILGHAHPDVVAAAQRAAVDGLSFGAPTVGELEMARLLCQLLPSLQQVRLVSSGTEATMSAIRLARGFTGRKLILKFAGCYHGHADSLLVKAGSGALTLGQPDSAGVPPETAALTLVLEFNDSEALERIFNKCGEEIAAVIVEPVAGNMNLVKPKTGFLQLLRRVCTQHGAVLIFDEVMTGFRVALDGAQGLYGIAPDLTTLGKVIGGGMPLGAFGGRKDIMQRIVPLGPVYQAGTLSGNPLAVAVGLATLRLVQAPGFYEKLSKAAQMLCDGLSLAARKHHVAFSAQAVGGMFGIYFRQAPPQNYSEVTQCNAFLFNQFFHAMLRKGVYFAPSPFEAGFVSAAHGDQEIAATVAAAENVFSTL
ncbi:MAG TPA: glutamate-1-semialdehyde 2,1-aminomutase [Burkholderiales bacterium]|nr:glutamate-1-semialdehyde 2,1-aminomutase [Burkholderiales bacterium]